MIYGNELSIPQPTLWLNGRRAFDVNLLYPYATPMADGEVAVLLDTL